MNFVLGNIKCEKGKKVKTYWSIEKTNYHIPVTIISGKEEGAVVVISSGVHACEYVGIQTAIELAIELRPEDIRGTLIIFHPINYTGFFKRLPFLMPEDMKNFNRVFPGNREGTISEKIAESFSRVLFPNIDYFIDLHGADSPEDIVPLIYFPTKAEDNIVEKSKRLAESMNFLYRVKSTSTASPFTSAATQGIPSLLLERGGRGLWSPEEVAQYKEDIYSALRHIGTLSDQEENYAAYQIEINEAKYLESRHNGFWYPALKAGDKFSQGAFLGEIRDCFGNVLESYKAEFEGVLLYQTISLAIAVDDPLIAYGKI